jgi:hypothetical protein
MFITKKISYLSTALGLTLLVSSLNPCSATKVVSLDIVEIYQKYSLVQEANRKIDEAEASFKRVIETADKELKELEVKGNEVEINKKKDTIQEIVDEEVEKLQDDKELYNTQINRNISKLLQDIALEKGIGLVIEKGYVQAPIEDITPLFLTRLEASRVAEAKAKSAPAAKPTKS